MDAWVIAATIVGATAVAAAGPHAVDPAFLGISLGSAPGHPGVLVTGVEDGTGAMRAGLQGGDEILRVDGTAVTSAIFNAVITAHEPGEVVHLLVLRDGRPLAVDATLSTRQDVLQRRVLGQPAPAAELIDLDDHHVYDLTALHGRPAVLAFVPAVCDDCGTLLRRVQVWRAHHRSRATAPLALAVVVDDEQHHAEAPSVGGLPVAGVATAVFERYVVSGVDQNRVTFLVIDARGRVAVVSPIAGFDDDATIALDDVLAACDHAGSR